MVFRARCVLRHFHAFYCVLRRHFLVFRKVQMYAERCVHVSVAKVRVGVCCEGQKKKLASGQTCSIAASRERVGYYLRRKRRV